MLWVYILRLLLVNDSCVSLAGKVDANRTPIPQCSADFMALRLLHVSDASASQS